MHFTIRRKPTWVTLSGGLGLLVGLGIACLLPLGNHLFVVLFAFGNALVFLAVRSFLVPFSGGIDIRDGRIEQITGLGGLISIPVDRIDHAGSRVGAPGLLVVPLGESIYLPASEYGRDDLMRLAHYLGIAGTGWSQTL